MASVQNVSLKQIVALCGTLDLLVEGMMEPNSHAMVVGMSKTVIFTKLTSKVLSEVEQQHPLEKIVHNAASCYTQETGEDSKVFLLLFRGIMNGIKDMLQDANEIEVRRTILNQISCLKSFLPDIFRNILSTYALYSNFDFHTHPKELESLVLTFFDSKFSANISKKLSCLMCSFLSNSISDSSLAIDALNYFISNFDAFCTKAIAPLSNSMVLEGFVLNKRLPAKLVNKMMVNFVVILDLPHKSDDAIWKTNCESFSLQFEKLWESTNSIILKHMKNLKISLILTEKGILDDFESLCTQNGIWILSKVSKEDIDNILHLVDIVPMNSLHDSVDPQNIGYLDLLTSHVVGGTSFTHIKVSEHNHAYLIPHHIFLCASLEEVLKDYYSECLNCLKAVNQWFQPVHKEQFYKEKMSKCSKIKEYLRQNYSNLLIKDSNPDISTESIISSSVLGVAFPLGLFEFALKNVLADLLNEKFLSVKKLCEIINSALMVVIHKQWNSPRKFDIVERNYVEFHKKIKSRIDLPMEPASSKENLLPGVLELVEQLVKIDFILSIKNISV